MVDIETLSQTYFCNMEAVPYRIDKETTILIRPVLVRDAQIYDWAKRCLLLDKSSINDMDIVKMSYLQFILEVVIPSDEQYGNMLQTLLQLCLNAVSVMGGKNCLIVRDNQEHKYVIKSRHFNDIAKIILHQNDADYEEMQMSDDVRRLMNDYIRIKCANTVYPNLEKRKAFVSSKTGRTFSELNMLPYREFDLLFDACKDSEMYIADKIIQGSYKYDVKENILHPLFAPKHNIMDDLFVSTSTLSNKGIQGAEQLNNLNIKNALEQQNTN